MTAYETLDCPMVQISETNKLMFGYFSIVSAFLVRRYLVSHKLDIVLV